MRRETSLCVVANSKWRTRRRHRQGVQHASRRRHVCVAPASSVLRETHLCVRRAYLMDSMRRGDARRRTNVPTCVGGLTWARRYVAQEPPVRRLRRLGQICASCLRLRDNYASCVRRWVENRVVCTRPDGSMRRSCVTEQSMRRPCVSDNSDASRAPSKAGLCVAGGLQASCLLREMALCVGNASLARSMRLGSHLCVAAASRGALVRRERGPDAPVRWGVPRRAASAGET